jgi:predicted nucleotidyltransferase
VEKNSRRPLGYNYAPRIFLLSYTATTGGPHAPNREQRNMIDDRRIVELSDKMVREFRPERIILFGSYAHGQPRPDSDVDLLVVLPFEGKCFRKSLEILNRISPEFSVDLLARRPEDTERRYAEGDPLIRDALDHGKVLYERHG